MSRRIIIFIQSFRPAPFCVGALKLGISILHSLWCIPGTFLMKN